jgi:hypothetical protein
MSAFALMSARQNLVHAERLGDAERVKRVKARIAELEVAEALEDASAPSNSKAELLEAAEAAGVEADESMTKAEILEALDGAE